MKLTHHLPRIRLGSLAIAGGLSIGLLGACSLRSDAGVAPPSSVDDDIDAPPTVAPIPDGRHFGTITAAYVGPPELTFDQAKLFTGDAAAREARADGIDPADIGDVYVRDVDDETVSLAVATDVVVTIVDCGAGGCVEGAEGDYDSLTLDDSGTGSYWITVDDGVVVRIDQQYLP